MNSEEKNAGWDNFKVILLAVIFDPKTKKILIGRRENDPYLPELSWCFPGGRMHLQENLDQTLKRKIKEKTGLTVKNLGAIFADNDPRRKDFLMVYFLCESFSGKIKEGGNMAEVKWADPEELEKLFKVKFNTRLREYLISLK